MTEPDVKQALERLGDRFEPPPDGLYRTRGRRDRRRRRRRVSAALVALAVAAGGGTVAWRAFSGTSAAPVRNPRPLASAPTPAPEPTPLESFSPPDCPTNEGEFSLIFGPGEGTAAPGTRVIVGGPVPLLDRGDEQVRPDTVWVWWNLDPADVESGLPGGTPVPAVTGQSYTMLAQVDVRELCEWKVEFHLPQVDPGTYPIVAAFGSSDAGPNGAFVYRVIPVDVGG